MRALTKTFATLLPAIALIVQVSAADVVVPRENINTFSQDPQKLQKLRDAVAALQQRGLDNSTSWFTLAGIHDIEDNAPELNSVPTSIQALFHQCHQDEHLFFLWHRAYVSSVERLMQDVIGDPKFRLPYWDWYSDPRLPSPFRDEFLDAQHTIKNPLYRSNRNKPTPQNPKTPDVNRGDPVWDPRLIADYDTNDFSTFQDQLNGNEHGNIHVLVGNRENMGSITYAARDPLFYLHHANIDRLLMVWLRKDPAHHKPLTSFPQWKAARYRFPTPPGTLGNVKPQVATPTVNHLSLGTLSAMGYTYDNLAIPTPGTPPLPTPPPHLQAAAASPAKQSGVRLFAMTAGVEKPLELSSGGTVQLKVDAPQKDTVRSLAIEPRNAGARLSVVLDDVHLREVQPGVASYQVFINLPAQGASSEAFRDHFVGTISLFNLEHAEKHGHTSIKLPLSTEHGGRALTKSLGPGKEPSNIDVSFVPVMAPGVSPPTTPVVTIGQVRLEATER